MENQERQPMDKFYFDTVKELIKRTRKRIEINADNSNSIHINGWLLGTARFTFKTSVSFGLDCLGLLTNQDKTILGICEHEYHEKQMKEWFVDPKVILLNNFMNQDYKIDREKYNTIILIHDNTIPRIYNGETCTDLNLKNYCAVIQDRFGDRSRELVIGFIG